MTPTEIMRAVLAIVPEGKGDYGAIQIIMLGPDMAEVKVQRLSDLELFQGVVPRRDWVDPKPCPAVLNIAGEHFDCDWPTTNSEGKHDGWAHSNKEARAIWDNDRYEGRPKPS